MPTIQSEPKVLFQWQAMSGDSFLEENCPIKLGNTTSNTDALTTELAVISQENGSTFETRTVDISAYAGSDIYISLSIIQLMDGCYMSMISR